MKKVLTLCLALLFVASVTALAQDYRSQTIPINGGKNTVFMGKAIPHKVNPNGCVGFYDNICGSGYQSSIGWTISDGSPVGAEWSPSNQFTSLKTGTTKTITVGVGFVEGTNSTLVDLIKDCTCKGEPMPCTNPDGEPKKDVLCHGTIKNMPTFGSTGTTTVSFKCAAKLTKGKSYWVLMQSPANSWLAWNYSNSAVGNVDLGYNDVWTYFYTNESIGALTIQ